MQNLLRLFLFLSFILIGNAALAQDKKPKSVEKQKKEFLKLQEERKEKAKEAEEEGIKRHEDIQTKDVKKRMKKARKKSERMAKDRHQDGFFQRLFTKGPKR